MAAVPINPSPETSEEEFSNSEVSYSSEDDSMEDEPSDSENTNGVTETEANGTKDGFWVRYPSLKTFLGNMIRFVGNEFISEYFVYEQAKLIGDEKAKELNDKCKALCIRELELAGYKFGLFADALASMKP